MRGDLLAVRDLLARRVVVDQHLEFLAAPADRAAGVDVGDVEDR